MTTDQKNRLKRTTIQVGVAFAAALLTVIVAAVAAAGTITGVDWGSVLDIASAQGLVAAGGVLVAWLMNRTPETDPPSDEVLRLP